VSEPYSGSHLAADRNRIVAVVCLAFAACTGPSGIDKAIDKARKSGGVPGMGYVLVVDGEVVLAGGSGLADLEQERPVTDDTAFMLASISKAVAGTSLLQVMEAGGIGLDDPVQDHLSWDLDNPRVDGDEIRISHLVTHTSGIRDADLYGWPGSGDLYAYGDTDITLEAFMEGYLAQGGPWYDDTRNFLPTLPGEDYRYSNVASALAGYLVEASTGIGLGEHAPENLFVPLGMKNTGWHLDDFEDRTAVAMPYWKRDGDYVAIGHFSYPDYPSGQLRSSPADLGLFMAMMLQGGTLDGVQVLEEETVALALDDVLEDHEGQGVFWYDVGGWGEPASCHSGSDYGVSTDLCLLPESGVGIAVLANTHVKGVWKAISDVEELLLAEGLEWADGP